MLKANSSTGPGRQFFPTSQETHDIDLRMHKVSGAIERAMMRKTVAAASRLNETLRSLRNSGMKVRSVTSNLGLYVYAAGAIGLGVLGFASGDFATAWQNVGPNMPFRITLAYATAALEIAAGIALLVPRSARAGALTLSALYLMFTLVWVPKALVNLGNYDPIGNVFEELALVAAGLVLSAKFSPTGSWWARHRSFYVLLFGVCPISFGIVHIVDMPGLLGPIPGWLPPNKMFWAYATTLGFFGAAIAILTGILAPFAARLLIAELVSFEFLFWIPRLHATPKNHFVLAGNAISIALCGAAWVISDKISSWSRSSTVAIPPDTNNERRD
jgi:uncharacterized membrane protein YphA (DoxX/SURF4 family)